MTRNLVPDVETPNPVSCCLNYDGGKRVICPADYCQKYACSMCVYEHVKAEVEMLMELPENDLRKSQIHHFLVPVDDDYPVAIG